MAHQALLIAGRKASITTPLHAGVHGAIERLSRFGRHVTLRIGSTELGILFLSWDQKNTKVVRVRTQSKNLSVVCMYAARLPVGVSAALSRRSKDAAAPMPPFTLLLS